MGNYNVTALRAEQTVRGIELTRIAGPGWTETPASLLDHLLNGRHTFVLADTDPLLRLAARRQGQHAWTIVVLDPQDREAVPENLPHWQLDLIRPPVRTRGTWWQRLLDPDGA